MKRISLILVIILIINIVYIPSVSYAQTRELEYVLFQNNFDNETAGNRPAVTEDNDPLLWTSLNHVRSPYQVVVAPADEGNYLSLRLNEGETTYIKPSVIKKLIVTDDCKINISFKIKTNMQEFELQCYDPDRNYITKALDVAGSDGTFEAYETQSDDGYALVNTTIDFSAKTYSSVFYDGTPIESGTLAKGTDITQGYCIRFQAMPTEGREVCIDDVKITTDKAELLNVKMIDMSSVSSDNKLIGKIRDTHPRIYINNFDDIKLKIQTDSLSNAWYQKLKSTADNYVSANTIEVYNPSSSTALATARRIRYKLHILSFMYALTDDENYKTQAYNQIVETGNFPNWNGYLQSAEISSGIAVAYDWMYNGLSDTQIETICQIMYDKGFYYALLSYMGISNTTFVDSPSNQNMACNSMYMMAALAFAHDYPGIAGYILDRGIDSLPTGLSILAPDGASPEGTGYWDYSVSSVFGLAAALDTAIADGETLLPEYDISAYEGLDTALYYPIYMQSQNGIFNYGDADNNGDNYYDFSFAYWAAKKYNNIDFHKYQYNNLDSKGEFGTTWRLVHKLAFYDPDFGADDSTELDPDKAFVSSDGSNVATMRTSWDGDGFFAGIQGGSGVHKHMYQSFGNFVLDFNGIRFATMRGRGNYDWPGYFDLNYQKWTYYISRAEGNNCVVLNPDEGPGQTIGSTAYIEKFHTDSDGAYAVMDLTDAYTDHVHSYKRGMKLFDNRSAVLLQDDIVSNGKITEGYWFMHTDAEITLSDDKKTATLTKDGQTITAKIVLANDKAVFSVVDAAPLDTSPNPAVQQSIDYGKKLAIDISGVQSISLAVLFSASNETSISKDSIVPIEYWGEQNQSGSILSYLPLGDSITADDTLFYDSFDDIAANTLHKYGYTTAIKTSKYAISGFGNTENMINNGYINNSFDGTNRFLEFVCKKYCDTPYILGAKTAPVKGEDSKYGSYIIEFDVLPDSASEISFYIRSSSFSRIEAGQINGSSSGVGNYNSSLAFGPVLKGIPTGSADYDELEANLISDCKKWHRVTILIDADEFNVTTLVNGFLVRKFTKDDFNLLADTDPGYFDMIEFRISAQMADNTRMAIDNLSVRKAGDRLLVSDTRLYENTYSPENIKDTVTGSSCVITKSIVNESSKSDDFVIVAASYTDDTLIDVALKEIILLPNEAFYFRHTLDTSADDSSVKVFVLDSTGNICPLIKNDFYYKID